MMVLSVLLFLGFLFLLASIAVWVVFELVVDFFRKRSDRPGTGSDPRSS